MKKYKFKSGIVLIGLLTLSMIASLVGCKDTETLANFDKKIIQFKFEKSKNPVLAEDSIMGIVDEVNHTVTLTIDQLGVDITHMIANFEVSDLVSIAIGKKSQEDGITANDFSGSVVYTLTAVDGSTLDYSVLVKVPKYNGSKLEKISFKSSFNTNLEGDIKGVIDETTHTVNFTMPFGTNINALKASFTSSIKSTVSIGGVLQVSDVTINDFLVPKIYSVKSEDGNNTQDYTITVVVENIMSYKITSLTEANAFNPVNGSVRNLTLTGFGINDAVIKMIASKQFNILGTLLIDGTKITSTKGLIDVIECKGSIIFRNNALLVDPEGFAKYSKIEGDLIIEGNSKFQLWNPGGLNLIERVEGTVRIVSQNILSNSLASLNYVGGDFHIEGGGKIMQLWDFKGMPNLEYIGGSLILKNNWFLYDYDALKSIKYIGENINITGNNSGYPDKGEAQVALVKYFKDNNVISSSCVITIALWDGTPVVYR